MYKFCLFGILAHSQTRMFNAIDWLFFPIASSATPEGVLPDAEYLYAYMFFVHKRQQRGSSPLPYSIEADVKQISCLYILLFSVSFRVPDTNMYIHENHLARYCIPLPRAQAAENKCSAKTHQTTIIQQSRSFR